jgi:hypothetical protein
MIHIPAGLSAYRPLDLQVVHAVSLGTQIVSRFIVTQTPSLPRLIVHTAFLVISERGKKPGEGVVVL